jgi:hypothetical protein
LFLHFIAKGSSAVDAVHRNEKKTDGAWLASAARAIVRPGKCKASRKESSVPFERQSPIKSLQQQLNFFRPLSVAIISSLLAVFSLFFDKK